MSLIDESTGRTPTRRAPKRRRVTLGHASNTPVVRSIAPAVNGRIIPAKPTTWPMPELKVRPPRFRSRVVDIRDHGARPDGQMDCAVAINDAIQSCHKAGGGRVLVPAGQWLTGPIHLRSNIDLHFAHGAIVRFSNNPQDYLPAVLVRWGGQECYNYSPLIYARGCRNVSISGKGTLLGQGKNWWQWHKLEARSSAKLYRMVLDAVPVSQRQFASDEAPLRPQFILAINCTNLLLEDFAIAEGGPLWTIHTAYCSNVIMRRLQIVAPDGPNNDGIVIDSSRDVLIEDCDLNTRSDCVGLKSGLNEDGWRVGRPTQNVIVRRIRGTGGQGGVAIGSETSGGVRNVLVQDCRFDKIGAGIRIKSARGRGGVVENVLFQDIAMGRNIGDAIQLTTDFSTFVSPDGRPPTLRNIHIRNVTCEHAATAVRMIGLPDAHLRDITLENVTIAADEGLHCSSCSRVELVDVRITPRSGPVMSLKDGREVLIHGLNSIDGHRVFLDLRGQQTRGIRLRSNGDGSQMRPTVVLGVDVPKDAIEHE
jgi:polygalacturonase